MQTGGNTSVDRQSAICAISFIDVLVYLNLNRLDKPDKVIDEDPIEMIHEEFNQIGVQPVIDVTFGSFLRNIIRQDPDIIMVGESGVLKWPRLLYMRS